MTAAPTNATFTNRRRSSAEFEEWSGGSEPAYDWAALVPLVLHPLKVEIVEALFWVGVPLSASDLNRVLDGRPGVGLISYHVRCLAKLGALEERRRRQVRGATERFYFFPA